MLLVADDVGILNAKDIEWSSKHMSTEQCAVEESELPADDPQPSVRPTKSKVKSKPRKVLSIFQLLQAHRIDSINISKQFDAVESKFPIGNNSFLASGQDDK